MNIAHLSKRSNHTTIAARTVIVVTLLPGVASAQTNPPTQNYTQCTLSNGQVNGPFGGYQVFGSFSGPTGAVPTVSNIIVDGAGSSGYVYHFTGPLNGNGYTVTSQIPPTPCVVFGCTPSGPGMASLHVAQFGSPDNAIISFTDSEEPFDGSGTLSCTTGPGTAPPPPPHCGPFHVVTSGNGSQNVFARYTPDGNMSLQAAAAACNY